MTLSARRPAGWARQAARPGQPATPGALGRLCGRRKCLSGCRLHSASGQPARLPRAPRPAPLASPDTLGPALWEEVAPARCIRTVQAAAQRLARTLGAQALADQGWAPAAAA